MQDAGFLRRDGEQVSIVIRYGRDRNNRNDA
jgi:hypothetical protein